MPRTTVLAALAFTLLVLAAAPAFAKARLQKVDYTHDGVELTGYVAWDDEVEGDRPGVLVIHEWWGNNAYARRRALELAELGYVAFAADMYGSGKTTTDPKQAGAWAGEIRGDADKWRARAQAGLDQLKKQPRVDPTKLAAIGYCFGGSTVLNLAYGGGTDLDAVVSFHGSLPVPTAEQAEAIKAKILICHGAEDAFIKPETITQVQDALTRGKVDWQMIYYAHAVHAFTNPDADKAGIDGVAYDAKADRRSWQDMRQMFDEVFEPLAAVPAL